MTHAAPYDLAVAYRIYPGVSKIPPYHADNKYKMSELCLRSFKASLGTLKVKIWALLDGCPPEYEALFREIFADDTLEVLNLDKLGNLKTFSMQIDILAEQTDAELVYFAEDDYFYLPGALTKMVDFIRANKDADFVSPYDHPDAYDTAFKVERHFIRPFGDRYWRSAGFTCLTFLTTRATLIRTKGIFRTFCYKNWDYSVWIALTRKLSLADLRIYWHDIHHLKIWVKTFMYGTPRLLFGRYHRLWMPLPSLSTHMESTRLAVLEDWPTHFADFERNKERVPAKNETW
ncbi:MAG: hypothetical protein WDM86_15695 [Rhizomicrobium sp.]